MAEGSDPENGEYVGVRLLQPSIDVVPWLQPWQAALVQGQTEAVQESELQQSKK